MFCTACYEILQNEKKPINDLDENTTQAVFIQHKDLSSLQAALDIDCYICSSFYKQLNDVEKAELWLQKVELCATIVSLQKDGMLRLKDTVIMCMLFDTSIELSTANTRENPAMALFVFQPCTGIENTVCKVPKSLNTSSSDSWNQAAEWLGNCNKCHNRCKRGHETANWFPTRLIDLGSTTDDFQRPRLVVSEDEQLSSSSLYVTLSHRWGNSNRVYLTRTTFEALRAGIEISELPQTFQDAIMITRERLAIRYLWIDTFCIFQDKDDLSDWIREAAQMNLVYENAYCNIAATGASDSTDGLFYDRSPDMLNHLELKIAFTVLDQSTEPTRYGMFDLFHWDKQLNHMPLHFRGWVLQERLLCPRVIHFCANQLIWECAELDATEAYPEGLPPAIALGAKTRFKSLDPSTDGKRLRERGSTDSEPRFYAHQLWPRIIESYTQCMLTNGGDKLIALSGIAKRMREIIKDEYVVGMWKRYLASELLWSVNEHRQGDYSLSVRPDQYRAPSFSWASVDGCISPATISDQGMMCTVEDVRIEYATTDTTGLVKRGHIILKGTLKRLHLRRAGVLDNFLMNVNGQDAVRNSDKHWEKLGPLVYLDVDQPDFTSENDAQTLFFMPIRGPEPSIAARFEGLILQHQGKGTYSRLGKCSTGTKEEIEIIKAYSDNEATLPCLAYDSVAHAHTIKVI